MEIKHLKYILEVARVGSITQASKILYVAQPNLSKIIKKLEDDIGITIFLRSVKGVELTREGQEFLDYSKSIIKQFEGLKDFYTKNRHDLITLSVSSARSSYVCASMISFLNKQYLNDPSLHIKFKEGTNFDVIHDVTNGNCDVGIIRHSASSSDYFLNLSKSRSLTAIPVCINKYMVLMSVDHPLASSDIVCCNDLQNYTEVIHGDFETTIFSFYRNEKINVCPKKNIINVYDRGSLLDIISNVHGTYMWTTSTHKKVLEKYDLIEKDTDIPTEECVDMIIYKTNSKLNNPTVEFIKIIKETTNNF